MGKQQLPYRLKEIQAIRSRSLERAIKIENFQLNLDPNTEEWILESKQHKHGFGQRIGSRIVLNINDEHLVQEMAEVVALSFIAIQGWGGMKAA